MPESELCRLLIDCLKKDGPAVEAARLSGLSPERCQAFVSLAAAQRVRPLLWHRLRQKGLDKAVDIKAAGQLREASSRNTMRNLRLYGELRLLLSALNSEGIPLILLKGIYLAEAVYGNMGLREMSDIDVLARPADLKRISDILKGMGYSPPRLITSDNHLPPMVKKGYATFELHSSVIKQGEIYSIDSGELWERAVPVRIAGCDALALSSEDLLLHLCLHTSCHHQFACGLRPYYDIAETISRFRSTLDWRSIAERTAPNGWQRGVYLVLLLARELADADVPADILERLQPADMNETILETARAQIFADQSLDVRIPATVAELLESRRLRDKIRLFRERIFLPRAMIASLYSAPMDSIRIYGYYPRRLMDVLLRHSRTLKKYRQNHAPLKTQVERTNLIVEWLTQRPIRRK